MAIKYVAVTGNDSAAGDIGSPWATLARAATAAAVGDTVQIRGGTYGTTFIAARDTIIFENYPGENVIIQRGTAGSTISFENCRNITLRRHASGGSFTITMTIAGNGQNNGLHVYRDASHGGFTSPTNFLVDGLIFRDIAGRGMRIRDASNVTIQNVESRNNAMGVAFQGVTGTSFIQDCHIHHIDRMLVSDAVGGNDAGGTGVELNMFTSGVIVRRNLIYECHAPSIDYFVDGGTVDMFGNDHCTVEDNIAYNNNGFIETGTNPGPTMDGNIIRRNLFYGKMLWNPGDPANFLYHRAGTNLLVYNNTIHMDDAGASGLTFHGIAAGSGFWAPVDGFKFKNNIMSFNSSVTDPYRIYNTTGNTGVEINYNLIYKATGPNSRFVDSNNYGVHQGTGLAAWRAASPYSDNDIWNANPLFTDPTDGVTPPGAYPADRSLPAGVSLPSVPARPAKYALYNDPWGTKGRVIGDSGQRHAYAKTQPWNADQSLLHFAYTGRLLNGSTYAVVSTALGNPGNFNWHPTNPVLGYSTQSGETNLYVHNVSNPSSPSRSTLHNFGQAIALGNGEGSISDNGWVALLNSAGNVATWNVDSNTGSGFWSTGGIPDSVTMSRDGNYVVAVFEPASSGHPNEIWAYNRDGSGAHRVRVGARHGDTAVDTASRQVWVQASGEMHRLDLTDGPNVPLFTGSNAFSPVHVSGRGQAGWALFSVYDTSASSGQAGNDTLCMVKLDGSGIVRIYGYANRRGTSYETQPQAVPSRDGLRVLTATDWGNTGTWAVVLGMNP